MITSFMQASILSRSLEPIADSLMAEHGSLFTALLITYTES